nr:MAG TPA: hypothetical protein [Caudoviricetes sp.]
MVCAFRVQLLTFVGMTFVLLSEDIRHTATTRVPTEL